jgi:hypothetical protein
MAPFWIMFGTPFPNNLSCDTSILFTNKAVSPNSMTWAEAYKQKMVESKALCFNSGWQMYLTVGPSTYSPQLDYLQPWYGYWLLVDRNEELSITFKHP